MTMPTAIPYEGVITGATTVITDFGLWGYLIAALMIGLAGYVFRRFGAKTR